jgi:hypothetical protein
MTALWCCVQEVMETKGLVHHTSADTHGGGIIGRKRIQHTGKIGGTRWQFGGAAEGVGRLFGRKCPVQTAYEGARARNALC